MTVSVRMGRRIAVFCGVRSGKSPGRLAAAREFGRLIGVSGLGLVYGGSGIGMMGAVSEAAASSGAAVTGVITEHLYSRERADISVADLRITGSMHERKKLMYELADAIVVLPGGIGTLDEFFEVLTWVQLGLHAKPLVLLDDGAFFTPLLTMLQHLVEEGFVGQADLDVLRVANGPAEALEFVRAALTGAPEPVSAGGPGQN
ncbi:TIGR00730 family Rossman fold protein [Streptomyces sp. WAC 05977]|nr:TIGR00730 family Rossman fold protein [Streptomyces sp. WAC 05977]